MVAAVVASGAAGQTKLSLERATLHQSEDGPPVNGSFEFSPGDTVYFSCQLAGYQKHEKDDKQDIALSYSVEARDARDILLAPAANGQIASDVSPEDKNWMPKIRFSFVLPPFAASGEYQIQIQVKDQYSANEARIRVPFTVLGRDVPASDTLVVRNFRFFRSEDDQQALQIPAYRPGDMVWARFDMTGYRLGEGNQHDVEYGVTVLRPNGEVTYSQPRAAEEKTQTFYPQRYVPGELSLSLPKDVKSGQYTIVLAVRDNLGGQAYEAREKFSVE